MSPLWAEKKLVHFLSVWGPIILSHGHINCATERLELGSAANLMAHSAWSYQAGKQDPANTGQREVGTPLQGWEGMEGGLFVFVFLNL